MENRKLPISLDSKMLSSIELHPELSSSNVPLIENNCMKKENMIQEKQNNSSNVL